MTRNPNALWVAVQLRETWEYGDQPHRFLIFDRDAKFSVDVVSTAKALGSQPVRTAFCSPWQNGIAERWVGSVRRDLLNHVIVLSERHLRRLLKEYVCYYHEDRTHLGLGKDTPDGRAATSPPSSHKVLSLRRLVGLHHRYTDSGLTIPSCELGSFAVRVGADPRLDLCSSALPHVSKTLRLVEGPATQILHEESAFSCRKPGGVKF